MERNYTDVSLPLSLGIFIIHIYVNTVCVARY